ncbi:MAG TPA: TIGR01212 family radical SAM protein [Geobacterales bacterium]|nr:TIGR01212 family radical SAM protein [Geobacterales bacterium]
MSPERPYHAFSDELKRIFGCRIQRISLDAGFSCPNRDGSIGSGGCVFCDADGSGARHIERELALQQQLEKGIEAGSRRYPGARFAAYFQAFSNTYAPVHRLRQLYDEALAVPGIVALFIGTRPDTLPPDVVDLLAEYHHRTHLWVEIGLQSAHDATLRFLNRGHDRATFTDAVQRCHQQGIRVCAHLIVGLPGEGRNELLATIDYLNDLGIDGIKIHLLHILEGTPLANLWKEGEIRTLERDEYVQLVCDLLERLDPRVLIQRLTGDGDRQRLLAPLWSLKKLEVINQIEQELRRRGTQQGSAIITPR